MSSHDITVDMVINTHSLNHIFSWYAIAGERGMKAMGCIWYRSYPNTQQAEKQPLIHHHLCNVRVRDRPCCQYRQRSESKATLQLKILIKENNSMTSQSLLCTRVPNHGVCKSFSVLQRTSRRRSSTPLQNSTCALGVISHSTARVAMPQGTARDMQKADTR